MNERERNRGSYEGRYDRDDQQRSYDQRGSREWEGREDYRGTLGRPGEWHAEGRDYQQQQERGYQGAHNDQHDRTYGASRGHDERNYAGRNPAYESQQQRYPGTYSSGQDQRHDQDWNRQRRLEGEGSYGQGNYGQGNYGQSSYGQGNYGQGQRSFGSNTSGGGYSTGYNEGLYRGSEWGRVQTPERYAQGDWRDRGFGYGHEGEQRGFQSQQRDDDGWGRQLREAGQEIARKVKRAFRGPKGYKRSDERVREDVNDRLAQQDRFDPSEIEVSIANGEVTLTGTVGFRHEKFLAEEIADDVSGVNEVHNQLRVRREQAAQGFSTTTTDTSATSATQNANEAALKRNARA
jgi:osmotically-inducible protein OsmY